MPGKMAEQQLGLGGGSKKKESKGGKTVKDLEKSMGLGGPEFNVKTPNKKERLPGRILPFKPDEQFITLNEASHYISAKLEELSNGFDDLVGERDEMLASGLPKSKVAQIFAEKLALINMEHKRVDQLSKEVYEATISDEAIEARIEGSENLVNNPYFDTQSEELVEANNEPEPKAEDKEEELRELRKKWSQLSGQLKVVMMHLKGTASTGEFKKNAALATAKKLEQPVNYPNIFELDIEKANLRDEYLRQAKQFEEQTHAEKRDKGYADQLHYLTNELEELNAALEAKTREVEFLQKMSGMDFHEAA
ncbi:MAG: hypothetical protein WA001_05270 [Patescibacteria group bacterium]